MLKLQSFLIFTILFFTNFSVNFAQEIKASVTVNYEQLPVDSRDDILSMKEDVETYLNSTRFTGMAWEGARIPVDVTIFLLSKSGNSYTAKLFILGKRSLDGGGTSVTYRILDDKWTFSYYRNAMLSYQSTRFDAFSSLLDFYIFTILGTDMDTYGELEGRSMFENARLITQLGASASAAGYGQISESGEYSRVGLIDELGDLRFEKFRKLIYTYFVDGMDMMAKDRPKAVAAIDNVLTDMVKFKYSLGRRSTLMQVFFDAKFQELADMFRGSESKEVFKKLKYLDPSHTSAYESAESGK